MLLSSPRRLRYGWLVLLMLPLLRCGSPSSDSTPVSRLNCDLDASPAFLDEFGERYASLVDPSRVMLRGPLLPRPVFNPTVRRFENGTTSLAVGTNDDVGRASVFQSDGKLVVAGRTFDGTYNQFAVARFWPDGSIDTSFETDGMAISEIWPNSWQWAHAVTIDNSNRIVAAGRVYDLQSYQFMIVRYESNGTLDTDFSGDGIQTVEFGVGPNNSADFARAIAVQDDNKIVVAGYGGKPGTYNLALARLVDNGTLDTSFHTDGKVLESVNAGDDLGLGLVLQTDSKSVVVGCTDNGTNCDVLITRFTAAGDLDATFDTDGINYQDISTSSDRGFAIALDTDQKFLIAGRTNAGGGDWDFAAMRFNADGSIDNTFDTDGIQVTDVEVGRTDSAHGVSQDVSGQIYLGGRARAATDANFALVRYDVNGDLDLNFETDGIAITDITSGGNDFGASQIYGDNKIMVVGSTNNGANRDIGVSRYNSDGSLARSGDRDLWFGVTGSPTLDVLVDDRAFGVAVQTDGKYVIAGLAEAAGGSPNSNQVAVIRYNTDGTLDSTFETDGVGEFYDATGCRDDGTDVAIQNGKIVVTGRFERTGCNNANTSYMVVRWDVNGNLDTTFHTDGASEPADVGTNDIDYGYTIAVQTDGKIVAGGHSQNGNASTDHFGLARWDVNGSLDLTFDTDGMTLSDVGGADQSQMRDLVIRPSDGAIYGGGFMENGGDTTEEFAVTRWTASGTVDNTFETDGIQIISIDGARQDRIEAIALQTDGKLVLAGFVEIGGNNNANREFAVARIGADGAIDNTFETDGKHYFDISGNRDQVFQVCIDPNSKIWLVGRANNDTAIARLLPNGTLDSTFDTDGIVTINVGGTDFARDCTFLTDGRLLMAGQSANDNVIYRIWP